MRILLIEDDPAQAEMAAEYLARAFLGTSVHSVYSESQFLQQFSEIERNPPDLFILDIMIRWSIPGQVPFYESPADQGQDYFRAGLRCMQRLNGSARTSLVPLIIHSVLDRADYAHELQAGLPSHYSVLRKSANLDDLARHIGSLFPGLHTSRTGYTFPQRLRNSFSATLRFLIFSVDLKKLFSRRKGGDA
jgi:CheY-like chemotaxis protein